MLMSSRIGHFAANTELYLCEKDAKKNVPNKKYLDIFYNAVGPVCNTQLDKMWRRTLVVMPWHVMKTLDYINKKFFNNSHEIPTHGAKDVYGMYDKIKPHLYFTSKEENLGKSLLNEMGIKTSQKFVCLVVRDSSYLERDEFSHFDSSYHSYRDCNISNYYKACEYLASKDIFVIRMGKKVKEISLLAKYSQAL